MHAQSQQPAARMGTWLVSHANRPIRLRDGLKGPMRELKDGIPVWFDNIPADRYRNNRDPEVSTVEMAPPPSSHVSPVALVRDRFRPAPATAEAADAAVRTAMAEASGRIESLESIVAAERKEAAARIAKVEAESAETKALLAKATAALEALQASGSSSQGKKER